jgi:segregation and condensation protein B
VLVSLLGKEHQPLIRQVLAQLVERYEAAESGLEIKQIANGFKMATKAEHHEWVRKYVKHQTPPTKLSLAALETLAVIAYKQPITVPEIQEVRGVNAVGVLKTLLDKKLITTTGRKNVIGRPILYKTTKEFLLHFGLKNLDELPSLEEFEDLARAAAGVGAETEVVSTSDPIPGVAPGESLELDTAEGAGAATTGTTETSATENDPVLASTVSEAPSVEAGAEAALEEVQPLDSMSTSNETAAATGSVASVAPQSGGGAAIAASETTEETDVTPAVEEGQPPERRVAKPE